MKKCCTCKAHKPLDEFYRDRSTYDQLTARCKDCSKAHTKRMSKQSPKRAPVPRSAMPKRCCRCHAVKDAVCFGTDKTRPDGLCPVCRDCRKLEKKERETRVRITREYRQRFPERNAARSAVNNAVRSGKLLPARSLVCVGCGLPAVHYHHHLGYSREHRLSVIPVCAACHAIMELSPR